MKKEDLVKIIEIIVSREVKKQLPMLLSEILSDKKGGQILKEQKPIQKNIIKTPTPSAIKKEEKKFSTNPILNEILNETDGFTSEQRGLESLVMEGIEQPSVMTDIRGQEVDIKQLPQTVANALTRNYSELLNKTNKIVQSKRPN